MSLPRPGDGPASELRQVVDYRPRPSFASTGVYGWLRSRELEGKATTLSDALAIGLAHGTEAARGLSNLVDIGLARIDGERFITRHADGGVW